MTRIGWRCTPNISHELYKPDGVMYAAEKTVGRGVGRLNSAGHRGDCRPGETGSPRSRRRYTETHARVHRRRRRRGLGRVTRGRRREVSGAQQQLARRGAGPVCRPTATGVGALAPIAPRGGDNEPPPVLSAYENRRRSFSPALATRTTTGRRR